MQDIDLNVFDEQLLSRRTGDDQMLSNAFDNLTDILDRSSQRNIPKSADAVTQILLYLGVVPATIPSSITDQEARIEYLLGPSGCMRRRVVLSGQWWKDGIDPFLATTTDGESVALIPRRFGGYSYRTAAGETIKINAQTAASILPDAYCIYTPFPLAGLTLRDLMKYLLVNLNKMDVCYLLLVSLVAALLGMVLPYANSQLYGTVIPSGIRIDILVVGFLLLGTAIGNIFISVARNLMMMRFSALFVRVQNAGMMRILSLPPAFFREHAAGEVASRLASLSSVIQSVTTTVLSSGFTALFSFVYIFQMRHFAPALVLPGLAIIFASLLITLLTTVFRLRLSRRRLAAQARLSAFMFALYSGMQKIKVTGARKRAFAKWAEKYREVGRLTYRPPIFLRVIDPLNLLVTGGGVIVLYYFAARSGVSAAEYLAFTAAFGAMSAAVATLGSLATTVADVRSNFEMVRPILQQTPEMIENRKQITSLSGNVDINGVSFRYSEDSPLVLDDLTLKIHSGEFLAIVGPTGSGKSTIIRLLLGFETPETGGIYYDGQSIDSIDLRSLRRLIGVDLQDGKLFAGSIFDNIVIAAPWKSLDDAWEAAELAGIADDIREMPMGMHTLIPEGGGGVSGGQRQRLLIARALISKPKIVIFDEATSALDNLTQRHVSESVAALKATRIVVAHRLSTIKECDRVVVLENGKIVEEGPYDDLIKQRGAFYELVKRQTMD